MAMKHFYVGVKAAIVHDGKLLVVHSPKGFWDLPGGRIDDDETIEQTLLREIGEELPSATNPRIGDIVHAQRKMKTVFTEDMGLVLVIFHVDAEFPSGVRVSDEHDDYRWVSREEAEQLDADFITTVAEKLL